MIEKAKDKRLACGRLRHESMVGSTSNAQAIQYRLIVEYVYKVNEKAPTNARTDIDSRPVEPMREAPLVDVDSAAAAETVLLPELAVTVASTTCADADAPVCATVLLELPAEEAFEEEAEADDDPPEAEAEDEAEALPDTVVDAPARAAEPSGTVVDAVASELVTSLARDAKPTAEGLYRNTVYVFLSAASPTIH